jgi:hypothetical protein
MRRTIGLAAFGAIMGAMAVAAQLPPLDRLAGVYRKDFPNGTVDGEKYQSENVLEIVPHSPTSAYFRTHLEFFNGHSCDIWGVADVHDGALVYDGPPNMEGQPCRLHLSVANGKLALADPDGACRADTCGARGGYDGIAFDLTARRPIRYMQKLLASSEFAEAVKQHDAAKPRKR